MNNVYKNFFAPTDLLTTPCQRSRGTVDREEDEESKAEEKEEDAKKDEDSDEEKKDEDKKKDEDSDEEEKKEPEVKAFKIGNLSLPASQQPGPLVGFGENVIGEGVTQLYVLADEYRRKRGYFIDAVPSILYGITDNLSVFFNAPIAIRYKEKNNRSNGMEDVFLQFEYAFYNAEDLFWTDQATVVANVAYPSGSGTKVPNTGFGSPSFFIGGTFNHTTPDWFFFGGLGATLNTFSSNTKFADVYLYEMGIGRNIAAPFGWIYAWMLEIDGQYSSRNIIKGVVDRSSGGNIVFVTPSLWISSEKLIFQLGAGGVLTQHLYGDQSHFTWQVVANLGWTL